jgi:hypothetical protein
MGPRVDNRFRGRHAFIRKKIRLLRSQLRLLELELERIDAQEREDQFVEAFLNSPMQDVGAKAMPGGGPFFSGT